MGSKLRLAQYGCGNMSAVIMRYAIENGAEVVCAFGRSDRNIGKDVGDIAGVGKTGVMIQDSVEVSQLGSATRAVNSSSRRAVWNPSAAA